MSFKPGDDVLVIFEEREARGVVLTYQRGYVMATIEIDPEWDYGSVSARLTPHSTVCVRERDVRLAATGDASTESSTAT